MNQTGCALVCAFLFCAMEIVGQSCNTPDGQQGHCVPLNECPKVFNIFASPPRGSETYLRQFLCNEDKQLKVCCGTAADFTILFDDAPSTSIHNYLHLIAFKRCSEISLSDIDLAVILKANEGSNVQDKRCLGILANPIYVITPAQCVVSNTQGQKFTVVGVKFRGKNNDSPTFGIEEVISHPFFDPVTGTNDIALLRLNQTVSKGNVEVLCYTPPSSYLSFEEESMVTYSNLTLSTVERGLNKTTVSITSLSKEECEEDFQQKGAHVVLTKHDICTKNVKNVTKFTCTEFTGVPLFHGENGERGYVGFSSSRTVCNDGVLDIYTKVEPYRDWLIDQMKPWAINSDSCTTPNGEIGECRYLSDCSALLDAFSSVTNATEAYLRGFSCEAGEVFPVCCVTSSNSTIVLKKDEPKLVDVPIQFLETRLCGLQHRDDYFSSSAAIAIDEFPWIALIENVLYLFSCTGTLINSRYVISTGACVEETDTDTAIVQLGNYNRLNETSCVKDPDIDATDCTETEKYGIEDKIVHPFFTGDLNNIGLLRLNKTVPYYTDFIRPICLPIPGTVTPKVGDTMYWSGWNFEDDSVIKKKVLTQLLHEEQCQRQFPAYYNIKHRNIICTLDYKNNTEFTEYFDIGGPLMFDNNYRWYIAGILWLPGKDTPSSYVNVLKYINWIIESMEPW